MKNISRRAFIKTCSGTAFSLGLFGPTLASAYLETNRSVPVDHCVRPEGDRVWIEGLDLLNYGKFKGFHSFRLSAAQNEIIGPNASGKTTIANALASLGPAPRVRMNLDATTKAMGARVEINGNPELLRCYRDLIQAGDSYLLRKTILNRLAGEHSFRSLEAKATAYFNRMIPQARNMLCRHDLDKILRLGVMGTANQSTAAYAFLFASRDALGIRLPLILDEPFSGMDLPTQHALSAILAPMETQVILLMTEYQRQSSGWISSASHLSEPRPLVSDGRPGALKFYAYQGDLRRALYLPCSRHYLSA
jgi:energy-coupling factor transporter ATP-binding protein EcfA2